MKRIASGGGGGVGTIFVFSEQTELFLDSLDFFRTFELAPIGRGIACCVGVAPR